MEIVAALFVLTIVLAGAWRVYVRLKGAEYWHSKANAEHFVGRDNSKALTYIDRALSIDAENKQYIYLKIHLLHELGRHREAREWEAKIGLPGRGW